MEEVSEPEKSSVQVRDFGIRARKKSRLNKLFLLGAGILLLIIGSFFIFPKKPSEKTNQKIVTKTATSSAVVKSTFCNSGQDFKNTKQGYEVCFPDGWVKNSLGASDLKVGFDPKQVDSSHEGIISVLINDKAEDLSIQDTSNNSSKFEYDKTTLDNIKGTKIIYTRMKGDPNPQGIDTILVMGGRTYIITLKSTDESYEENKILYEKFLSSWKFLKDTPKPPWSNSGNILVFSPWINDSATSPLEVSGEAIAFEGVINIRVKDDSGHVLEQTTTQTQSGNERSPFKMSVTFDKPSSKKGGLEVYIVSAKDGSEQDKVTIPLQFK